MINASDGPAYGAAILAQVGTGGFAGVPEACDAMIRVVDTTPANAKAAAVYERAYPVYQKLYRDLKETFGTIASLAGR